MRNNNSENAIYFSNGINVRPIYNDNFEETGCYIDEDSLIYTKEDDKYIPYPVRNQKGRLYVNLK